MGQCLRLNQERLASRAAIALLGGVAGSIMSLGLFANAATAARLQSWRFDAAANRLEFLTDEVIQPRVQLLPNPVRLVVDLPGVQLERPTLNQAYSAAVRSIRIGQFDAQTARIVVELSPGYTVDPQQVKVNGNADASWSIDLPTPQLAQNAPDNGSLSAGGASTLISAPANDSNLPDAPQQSTLPPSASSAVIAQSTGNTSTLEDVLVTTDGLFLKTRQAVLGAQVTRSRNRREIFVDLNGLLATAPLTQNEYRMNYHGVQSVSVRQLSAQPPVTRVTLKGSRNSPDWIASASRFGGVVLLPQRGGAATGNRPTETISLLLGRAVTSSSASSANSVRPSTPFSGGSQDLATLRNISLGGSQLLIQADRLVSYTMGWEGSRYRITLRSAQWSTNIRSPQTGFGSAITDIALRQEGQNASILITPAPGIRIGTINRSGSQGIVLNLNRGGSNSSPTTTIFQPNAIPNTAASFPQPILPRPNGRRVVVIDPGHGGTDPGAIGIGGLRETNITLPISLEVTRLLQQQGLQVYLTRADESREVDLPPRVALAKQVRADVFVSIHANAINLSRPDINGTEVYYAPGSAAGAELSRIILNSITRSVNIPSRGVRSARFYVVRNTPMPATLIETGFVTGAQDAPKLGDPNFQRQMAAAIAQGIIEFLNQR
jgi:N-acetylmuramoyl-L-alanine amidase